MKNFILLILLLLGSCFYTNAQDFYVKKWQQVEKLEVENKVEDAHKIINEIYKRAKRKKDHDQLVKTFLFRSKFNLIKEENGQEKVLAELDELIDKAKFPTKNVYHSIYAKLLGDYVNQNRWNLQQRTAGGEMSPADFKTWDIKKFYSVISGHHQAALKNSQKLGTIPVGEYAAILGARPLGRELRPTLLDLLSREALGFYKKGYYNITKPKETFTITEKNAFLSTQELQNLKRPTGDTIFSKYDVLQLYASLEQLHKSKNDAGAYVSILLERLEYEKNFLGQSKDLARYSAVHNQLLETYKNKAVSTLVSYSLADYHYQLSLQQDNNIRQIDRVKAIEIAKKAIDQFPESYGAVQCMSLLSTIYRPSLTIQHQDNIVPDEPHRGVISYRNVDTVSIHYIKVSYDFEENLRHRDSVYRTTLKAAQNENRIAFSKEFTLKTSEDTFEHTYEFEVDGLRAGTYLVITETNHNDVKELNGSVMTVSQMALFHKEVNGTLEIQVLDRKTGRPISGVELELSADNSRDTKKARTDSSGKARLKTQQGNRNYDIKASKEEDIIQENFYSYNRSNNTIVIDDNEIDVKSYLYLDRAIYRPGQTVYFKGIIVAKKGETSFVVPNEDFDFYVEDVNGEDVYDVMVTTNEYGSFHGEFTLPKETLTGEFSIWIDSDEETDFWDNVDDFDMGNATSYYDDEFTFKVEEYKRPRFKAGFKEVKETYAMNDSVVVTAFAKALLGSNITDADVHFKVTRSASLPWWKYSGYYSDEQIIVDSNELDGDFVTNNKGELEIKFKAVADSTLVAKNVHPIYNYRIEVEVTDVNGETRTAATSVRVGKQIIEITSIVPQTLTVENNEVKVAVKNLNGQLVTAEVEVQIRQLKTPDHVVIPSKLKEAEFHQSNDVDYRNKFPFAELRESEIAGDYKTAPILFKKRLTIDSLTTIKIPITANWDNGNYVMYTKAVQTGKGKSLEKEEDVVEEINKVGVWANQELPITPEIISHNVEVKDNIATVNFYTSMDGVYLKVITYDAKKLLKEETIFITKGKATRKYQLITADKNLMKFYYSVQKENHFTTKSFQAQGEQKEARSFDIETSTFRDKLYPGMEEEWSFTIKDEKGKGMNAEVLASMYDKSLDEFTSKDWSGFSFYDDYDQFDLQTYRELNNRSLGYNQVYINYKPVSMPQLSFDQFKYFGLSFNVNQYQYSRYKSKLARQYAPVEKVNGYVVGRIIGPDGDEVIGATISIKGTNIATSTDFDGLYKIAATSSDVLIFSYTGYSTQEIVVGKNEILNVGFDSSLDSVVIQAYRSVSSNQEIAAVENDDQDGALNYIDRPNGSVIQRLQGQMPGLEIQNASGQPGANSLIQLRGVASYNEMFEPLVIIDGVPATEDFLKNLDPSLIKETAILKDVNATAIYGNRGANGVIIISTKEGVSAQDLVLQEMALNNVQIRKDLKETAFFLPELKTDKEGNLKFSFISPEMLTQWKLRLFAHNKQAETAYLEKLVVTQKELSLVPNAPRFLRETDTIRFSTKIANLSDAKMEGIATLKLFDALTMQPIDQELQNTIALQNFTAAKGGNASVNWTFVIPVGTQAVTYRVIAKAGQFSDGEENTLPVLTNRMLVTESRSLWVRAGETESVTMDKLANHTSTTLENHQMTFEYTSNPSWYAIKSLPYLMEYEHECAEQTFSKYYANAMAAHILNSSPKVKEVFDSWAANGTNKSKLEQSEELKSVILAHTPWLRDAQSEAQKQQRLATLFDLDKTAREKKKTLAKLEAKQGSSGGFPWFSGGNSNEYITRHIAAGIGHLNKLGVNDEDRPQTDRIYKNAIAAVDRAWVQRFNDYLKNKKNKKEKYNFSASYWHYQYARSFEKLVLDQKKDKVLEDFEKVAFAKAEKEFASQPLYTQLLMAIALHRNGENKTAAKILEGLRQTAVVSKENGMYWKENTNSWYWYSSDIETQALAIEAFMEIENDTKTVEELQVWLLKKKRTTQWKSTKATADATYALLLQNGNWTDVKVKNKITWAGKALPENKMSEVSKEAGTGYFKISLNKEEITKKHATVEVKNRGEVTGYGGFYWQYFENLDKITTDDNGPLSVKKRLYKKVSNNSGEELKEINSQDALEIGDLVTVRIEIKTENDMDFVHLKDMRASGFEPVDVLSEYKWQDGLGYYQSTKDVATHFFFDNVPKGTYVFEYEVRANNAGNFSNGITNIESMYAPEFSSHSAGERVVIEE
jgi:TonB-dependent SusC/RagA subfamily outer membrane receptor